MDVFGPGGGGGATVFVTVLVSAGGVDMTVVDVWLEPPQPARNSAAAAMAVRIMGEARRCRFTAFHSPVQQRCAESLPP
ncbi:hypothetical protein I550_1392 [Mycobacterium intracellulare 1956]|uniref:Uncharacterized protein n=1 Tax=Mycobacterium intracellulare 1956 TaxID=1299331 RepID=X8CS20_MYCIT|nr:hypothetical protein I548_4368 [Mycobacterium intracellulare]EUA58253.1 hypothetical protein I550_1392 [Mycobacterium intracellulare 1956]